MTSVWFLCLALGLFVSVEGTALYKGRQKRSDPCPQDGKDWRLFQNSCYLVRNRRYTYEQAVAECTSDKFGSVVSTIGDQQENEFMLELTEELFKVSDVPFWIGGSYTPESNWTWGDGSKLEYGVWAIGQPDTADGHCLAIGSSGKWKANDCTKLRRFVCERPAATRSTDIAVEPAPPATDDVEVRELWRQVCRLLNELQV